MIRVSVLYPQSDGARFDWAYYTDRHIPLLVEKLGDAMKGISIEQGLAGGAPGSAPTYVAIAQLHFESVEAFQGAFGPNAPEIMGDVAKYTSIQPVIQISEVKISR